MSNLRVSPTLTLPPQAVTETFGILAVRGAGKSNTAAVMAEEMFEAKLPFVVIDPVRAWWGLRSSRDGTGPGLPIPIFGGRRGDVPLERGGGTFLADLIVDQRLSCILDISDFGSEAAKKSFLLDFAQRLYQRNETPLHLFLEEADDYIPQKPMRDELHLLRAWENIVRRGRGRGLGCTLITQRSAVINKDVLYQVQTLIPMRTTGPGDIDTIAKWVRYHHQPEDILASLPSLQDGEAWVWSPNFLRKTVRVRFRLRETFDSGATPKMSATPKAPATLADVDLGAIRTSMAATIEKAKAEDPRELQKRVRELTAELERAKKAAPATKEKRVEVKVAVLNEPLVRRLEAAVKRLPALEERYEQAATHLVTGRGRVLEAAQALERRILEARTPAAAAVTRPAPSPEPRIPGARPSPAPLPPRPTSPHVASGASGAGDPDVGTGGLRRMLVALAQRPQGLSARQLGVRAGLSSKSGTFDTYLSRGRQKAWVEGDRGRLRITTAGVRALGDYDPLPEGRELLVYWLRELGESGAARMLRALADVFPRALTRTDLGEAAGLTGTSGTFDTYLSRLRSLELVEGKAELRASEELFG